MPKNKHKKKRNLILNRKEQAALEYLVTYGWAILVVLVAIAGLAYFGVFSSDKFIPSKCILPPGISCLDFKVENDRLTGNGKITLRVQNSLGEDISINNVAAANCGTLTTSVPLANGEAITLYVDCTTPISTSKYNEQINITYASMFSGITHILKGDLTSKVSGEIQQVNASPDTTLPTVSITSPINLATVSGTISVTATASDNIAVAGVQFKLDSINLGAEDTTSPYSISWNTSTSADGLHSLTATARDTSNNLATSSQITVNVSNTAPPQDITPPVISNGQPIGTLASGTTQATLSVTTDENANCKYSTTAGQLFSSMTLFTTTGTTSHSYLVTGLSDGNSYTRYVKCQDTSPNLNTNPNDYNVSFSVASPSIWTIYYLSPSGSDTNNGLSETAPFKTFNKAFTTMAAGDELVLLNGTYSVAAGTGYIDNSCAACAQIPSGANPSLSTYVHAKNLGAVTVDGGSQDGLVIGTATRKDSYIKIQGITFVGGGWIHNGDSIIIKEIGFQSLQNGGGSVFGTGAADHTMGTSNILIEDSWIWGRNRIAAIAYRSDHVVWRRVLIRNDGCNSASCAGSPNLGITAYESAYVSMQNVIVMDRILGGGGSWADFATAMNTAGQQYGAIEWLGTISLGSPDLAYQFAANQVTVEPAHTMRNCVGWKAATGGINDNGAGIMDIQNCNVNTLGGFLGIRLSKNNGGNVVQNVIVTGNATWGVSTPQAPSYVDLFGTWSSGAYNQAPCSTVCLTTNPQADGPMPSLKYPLRIETGSALKGAGSGGADIGANIVNRYGIDGALYGDTGYNTPTSNSLWPWPNEDLIKQQMCDSAYLTSIGRTGSNTPGWCASGKTLTNYIWEYLGNPYSSDTTPPVISSVSSSSITSSSASISWTTNEASDSQVEYGTTTSYGSSTALDTNLVTSHSTALSGLSASTLYHYRVKSRDAAGNLAVSGDFTFTTSSAQNTYFISPTGSDTNNGLSEVTPFKTFVKAFATMTAGDELVLLDGTYSVATGTGYISYLGTNSAQIPSGIDRNRMTYVHAKNPGNVKINGGLFIGRSTRKDSYIKIEGLTFDGGTTDSGGSVYNAEYIYIKNSGFHTASQGGNILGVGTNDASATIINSNIIFEDVWVWGNARIGLIVYRSHNVVARRVVVRQDGCYSSTATCGNNPGNQMVGMTVYNSFNVSFQNVITFDNILGPNGYAGASDFATAWHNNFVYPFHSNEWRGTISLNSGLSNGYHYDLDNIIPDKQPMATYENVVAWDVSNTFNAQMNCGTCAAQNINILSGTFRAKSGNGFRIGPNMNTGTHIVRNIIVVGNGTYGVNSVSVPSYVDVFGTWSSGAYSSQSSCTTGCKTSDPIADGSIKYITRIESGSPLKGTGFNGEDYGANVVNRYGTDGAVWGDPGYNTLTSNQLWPWPNEARIKQEMCADETRGFCSAASLSRYIWEYLGNPCPAGMC